MYLIEHVGTLPVELSGAPPTVRRRLPGVVWLAIVAAIVKAIFFFLDPKPGFHFGDSASYLATALIKWIPPDRSFSYGFFLRPLVLYTHSLTPVVLIQVAMSAFATVLVGYLLLRYFGARLQVALAFTLLCAVEPLQLMEERFIMTEALATFFFALLMWTCVAYVAKRKLGLLVLAQLLGVVLVSLRFSFLPLVMLLPLLALVEKRKAWVPLCVAILCSQVLLFGYRHLYGCLENTRPSYLSRDGDFLVADMSPLITPSDYPIASQRDELFRRITIPLGDIDSRKRQRWDAGGLCVEITRMAGGNDEEANRLMKKTALRAMKRNPLGVLRLGAETYGEFFSRQHMEWGLALDQWGRMLGTGQYVPSEDKDAAMVKQQFGIEARMPDLTAVSKRWESMSWIWCSIIVLLPALYAAEILWHHRQASAKDIVLLGAALCSLASAVVPVEIANPRYLVPLPWLSVLIVGVMATRLGGACKRLKMVRPE